MTLWEVSLFWRASCTFHIFGKEKPLTIIFIARKGMIVIWNQIFSVDAELGMKWFCQASIARKVVPAPLFKAPTPWPNFPASFFLKLLFLLPSFLFHPFLRYFRQSPLPTISQTNPSCPNPKHQTSFAHTHRFLSRQLRITFCHKIMVAEKIDFSSNA